MRLQKMIVQQARKPTGTFGRLMARGMNHGHKVARWGLDHIAIGRGDVILDVGCGGGKTIHTMAGMATEGRIYGIDYSEDCVTVASRINRRFIDPGRVQIIQASVESIPFPDNFFDHVISVESYYFWPDLVGNLKEINRVLKAGGQVSLIAECYRHGNFEKRNEKWARLGGFDYLSPDEFVETVTRAGYSSAAVDVLEEMNWIIATGKKADKPVTERTECHV
ncbi:MAG: class I SAM-dependent methyltransferase [Spirochaetes bacterium]|nr:class I SAM-dependent methyltransferase [Spirochaetota bacterium]